MQAQNPADFSPDPPPQNQPAAQPAAAPPAAGAQAAQPTPGAQPQPTEDLPPPTAAQVTYRNNQLTVQAMNCTLAGLLVAIRNKTGIQFEGLENAATERVAISMGPASEGEVLAAILGGSKYDYVVVERPDSPGTVQRVLLSPRGGATAAVAGAAPAPIAANADGDDEDLTDEAENPQDTAVRPPIAQEVQPQEVQPQQQPQQPAQPAQAKTPEQLLEELKRMQQQHQQQQGQTPPQQNAPVKGPPNPQ
jgi:hypothetical protein